MWCMLLHVIRTVESDDILKTDLALIMIFNEPFIGGDRRGTSWKTENEWFIRRWTEVVNTLCTDSDGWIHGLIDGCMIGQTKDKSMNVPHS